VIKPPYASYLAANWDDDLSGPRLTTNTVESDRENKPGKPIRPRRKQHMYLIFSLLQWQPQDILIRYPGLVQHSGSSSPDGKTRLLLPNSAGS
jgi:hypothetical protein